MPSSLPRLAFRRLQYRQSLICIVASFAYAGPAQAELDIARARQLFEEASTLRETGHYADALVRLRLAIAIKDTPGLEYHAGFCEAKLGHYVKAIEHFERAATLIRSGASAPDVAALLDQAHRSAAEQVARVRVSLTPLVAGASVRVVEGPERPLPPRERLVEPGSHQLLVRAPGHTAYERAFVVRPAEDLQLDVSLARIVQKPSEALPAPAPHSVWRTASIGSSIGITALGLSTGIIATVGYANASDAERAAQAGGDSQSARLAAAQHDKQTYATLQTAGFLTAGVGAVATIALWVLWPATRHVSVAASHRTETSTSAGLWVTATF